ncbi:MAG: LPS assembly protein LptD [Pseudomonadota bacterium]
MGYDGLGFGKTSGGKTGGGAELERFSWRGRWRRQAGRTALAWLLASLVLAGGPATAQLASLVADGISVEGDGVIVAEGNVEIFYEGATLKAARLRYDGQADTLTLDGPIRVSDGEGVEILADAGELDADLRNGVLRSARLVLDRQLQLSAARIRRVDGRYTELSRTIATSCRICGTDSPPIWEIRASRVVHDQEERQIYLDNAQFRVVGIPVFYWPSLRFPDPSLDRSTGFLFPELVQTTQLGTGLKIPYFIKIGDHADLTLTPYFSAVTATLEARYRQEFRGGRLSFEGAVSNDNLRAGERSYLFGRGQFALPRGYRLGFDVELVSDPSYLLDYDFSEKDRLDSGIAITRVLRDERVLFEFTDFRTLRDSEIPIEDELPNTLFAFDYERQLTPDLFGGPLWFRSDVLALTRPSATDEVGRDVFRTGAALTWTGTRVVGPGIVAETQAGAEVDIYAVNQDERFGLGTVRTTPSVALTLRWPFQRVVGQSTLQSIEPVAQLAWSRTTGADVPDEDSNTPELDQGNLFSLSRYPGSDRNEEGLRGAAGLTWTNTTPSGGEWSLSVGRIFRFDDRARSAEDVADWLASIRVIGINGFQAFGRVLAEDDVGLTRAFGTVGWSDRRTRLNGSLIRAFNDPDAPTADDTAEIAFDGSYDFSENWTGALDWRYDLVADRATRAGLSLRFRNECVDVEFELTQRFTDTTSLDPTTRASISVALGGFGAGNRGPVSQCRG